ncbi:MAG: phage tail length tape measure family protein [Dechloromonas sp.]|nr:phage tail length tape measure family protein [Dechloromonas sp.]
MKNSSASSNNNVNVIIGADVSGLRDGANEAAGIVEDLGKKTGEAGEKARVGSHAFELISGKIRNFAADAVGAAAATAELAMAAARMPGPWLIAAAAVGTYAKASHDAMVETRAMDNAMAITSNYAGMTAGTMRLLAEDVAAAGTATIGQSKEIVTALVASGKIGAAAIGEVSRLSDDYAAATGKTVGKIAPDLVRLFADPAKGARELNESMHFLTETQIDHIESLQRLGDAQGAQLELAQALANHLPKHAAQLGTLERAWDGVKKAASSAWDSMMGVGRESTPEATARQLASELDALASGLGTTRDKLAAKVAGTTMESRVAQLEAGLREATRWASAAATRAAEQAASAADNDRRNQAAGLVAKYSTQAKVDELMAQRKLLEETGVAGSDEAIKKIDAEIAKLREVKKERASAAAQLIESVRERIAIEEAAAGTTERLSEGERIALRVRTALANGTLKMTATQRSVVNAELDRLIALEKSNAAEKEAAKIAAERAAMLGRMLAEELKRDETIEKANEKLRDEIEMLGISKDAQGEYRAAKIETQAASEAATAAAIEEQAEMWKTLGVLPDVIEGYLALAAAKRESAADLTEQARLLREKGVKEVAVKAAEDATRRWAEAANDISRSLTDALMRGFESGRSMAENLISAIKSAFGTMVLRPIVQAVVMPISNAVGSAIYGQAASSAVSGGTNIISSANALNNLYDGITSSFGNLGNAVGSYVSYAQTASGYTYGTAAGSQQSMMLAAQDAGLTTTGSAATMGTAASYLGGALAGYALGKMISGGYSVIGKSGNTAVMVGTAIGSIWGPIGAAIGGAIGGLINRAFGMGPKKVTAYGVTGTFGDGDFEGKQFQKWKQDGGLFRSDKKGTNYSPLAASADYALSMTFRAVQDSAIAYAEAIGLGTSAIEAYSKSITINLKGLSDEEKQAKWDELFATMSNEMAALAGNITAFAHTGETASQVLERLATNLTAVNAVMDSLGDNAFAVSLKGAGLASQLVDLVGGLQNFSNLTGSYYQNFYTEQERFDAAIVSMRKTLIEIGVTAIPTTRQAFRDLMEAQDLTTVSGQATYAALLQVSSGFATLIGNIENQIAQLEAERLRLAQQILDEHDNLLARAAELTGNTQARLAAELAGIDPLNRSLYLYVDALERAQTATESISASFDALAEAGGGIASFVQSIRQSLIGLASGASLSATRAAYRADLDRARQGDVSASGTITGSAQAYLDAARSQSTSRAQYAATVARVAAELEALPATKSYAQQQVELLQQLNDGASDIEQALATLQSALSDAMAAGFGQLDVNTNGLLTYDELRAGLSGIATDAQLRALIAAADTNADGQISKLEAQAAATSAVADNTAGMPLDAQEQINELRRLVGETITNSGRILELNVSLQSLRNAIVEMTEQERTQAAINNKNLELEALTKLQEGMVGSVLAGIDSIWSLAAANKVFLNADAGAALKKNTAIFNVVDGTFVSDYDQITGSAANMDAFKAAFYAAGGAYEQTYGMADDLLALKAKIDAARQAIIALGGVPQFARGINEVPADMLAMIHSGERILPAADNRALIAALEERNRPQEIRLTGLPPVAMQQDDTLRREMLAELRALRAELANSRAESRSTALSTSKLARLVDRLMPDGDALSVRIAA